MKNGTLISVPHESNHLSPVRCPQQQLDTPGRVQLLPLQRLPQAHRQHLLPRQPKTSPPTSPHLQSWSPTPTTTYHSNLNRIICRGEQAGGQKTYPCAEMRIDAGAKNAAFRAHHAQSRSTASFRNGTHRAALLVDGRRSANSCLCQQMVQKQDVTTTLRAR